MKIDNYSVINKEDSTLRPYQQKAKKEIFESWDEVDNVMFQMPTGTGKTRLFTSIIRDINDYSKLRKEPVKILIIAHRTELIDQIDESLKKYHVPHNVIAGGRERNYKYPVNVASIQTLTHPNNLAVAKKLNVQFIIIDEAHHALAATYKKLWNLYPESKKLGVTATPWRMNHQSFLDLFETLVMSMPIKEFIKQGFLSPYKYFSLRNDSDIQKTIDNIELDKFGEYSEASMEEKMDVGSIRAQLLNSYVSLAEGKKGIIYAINIVHAKHIAKEYETAGYITACIDSKTPSAERKELVKNFKEGKIDIIVNVDIFSEGFDCPDIEFIQLARPTRSLVKYLQQVGRGLRPTANKENCVILDNVGMYSRFGLPDARRHWNYHFMGHEVVEENKKNTSKGTGAGRRREVDFSEGTEDMELIQDSYEDIDGFPEIHTEYPSGKDSDFDPTSMLIANHYTDDNFIFWFNENKRVYEAYIQDDKYFIISELMIDNKHHCYHRNRVGKIPVDSWMFWQMLREKVDNLKSITHYGANYTLFHYRVLSSDNTIKDKYFDYKGRELDSPNVVESSFTKAKKGIHLSDYIDVPVSKAKFELAYKTDTFTVYRTIKEIKKPMAIISASSDFGQSYSSDLEVLNSERKSMGLPKFSMNNTDWVAIVRSDDKSFTVKKTINEKGYLLQYNFKGKLLHTGTIFEVAKEKEIKKKTSLPADDINLLHHVFDSKATSYKYFWFMSILQLYKESQKESIFIRKILVRMIANAWKYVFRYHSKFSPADQLPKYLRGIQSITKIQNMATVADIEKSINKHSNSSNLNSWMMPLLKNVPYRFLSPWIPFTNNDDVIRKSGLSSTRCLYKLDSTHVTINELWRKYLLDNYRDIADFIDEALNEYLKVDLEGNSKIDFCDMTFLSLSQLLKEMRSHKNLERVKLFIEKYNLPSDRKLTPVDILEKISESKYTVDINGRKNLSVKEGQWTLNALENLLSESNE